MVQILPSKHIHHSHLGEDEARELALLFYEKGRLLTDKPFFKHMGDCQKISELFVNAAESYRQFRVPTRGTHEVHLVGFRHTHTQEIHGFLLYGLGYPWWSSTCLSAFEMCVLSLVDNSGIGRLAANFLKKLVDYNITTVVESGSTILDSSAIGNSYRKAGFSETPTFLYYKNTVRE